MADLPQRIAEGVAALREQRYDDAVRSLEPVASSRELAAADDLRDVRARVLSLYAQALMDAGRPHDADRPCRDALRILRALRDRAGVDEVRALQDRIVAALAHDAERARRLEEQRRVAATPVDELLAEATDDARRAELLVKKANAHHDVGQLEEGRPLAHRALEAARAAGTVHWQVLAHLSLARLEPDHAEAHLLEAHRGAERAGEFNLVSMVARAAEVAAVELPKHPGPHAPPEP